MNLDRCSLPLLSALCALALFVGACGGDDDQPDTKRTEASSDSNDNGNGDDGDGDGDGDGDAVPDGGSELSDAECEALRPDLEAVGVAIQALPQLRTPELIEDEFLLADVDATLASVDAVRPFANDSAESLLDDVALALTALAEGRNGDPAAAVAEIERITGGLDGLDEWLFRQLDLTESLDAIGCNY